MSSLGIKGLSQKCCRPYAAQTIEEYSGLNTATSLLQHSSTKTTKTYYMKGESKSLVSKFAAVQESTAVAFPSEKLFTGDKKREIKQADKQRVLNKRSVRQRK